MTASTLTRWAALTLICWLILGCKSLTLGPTIETRYVIVYPGMPGQVMDSKTVPLRLLGRDEVVRQDIGGWITMPREHFDALVRALTTQPKTPPSITPGAMAAQ